MVKKFHYEIYVPEEWKKRIAEYLPPMFTRLWLSYHYMEKMEKKGLPQFLLMPSRAACSVVDIAIGDEDRIHSVKLRWYVPCVEKDITVMINGNERVGYTALSAYWSDVKDVHRSLDSSRYEQEPVMQNVLDSISGRIVV